MGSLFQGSPQTATSYTTTNTETPKWMQDAIYNQIQMATNTANAPYQAYTLPTVAELSPLQQQAFQQVQDNNGAWKPGMTTATNAITGALNAPGGSTTAQPYMQQASDLTNQGVASTSMDAADPYLTNAAQSSVANINQYMNPYQQNVMDVMAKQGARNLTENLLPGVSDSFIKAGQFGSGRMGEFGERAVRDTNESIMNQQAQLANQGYTQGMTAANADLSRNAQLANTAGNLSAADLSRLITAGGQQAQIGQSTGTLTNADLSRQIQGATTAGALAQQGQSLRASDAAALEAAGAGQRSVEQQQLDAAKAQNDASTNYAKNQLDWLNTQIRGMAPSVPTSTTQSGTTTGGTYSASPLSQIASGMALYKGLSQ